MNTTAAAQYRAVQRNNADNVVTQHADLVRRIAHHLAARLPASVEVDDLIQAGMIGLIELRAAMTPNRAPRSKPTPRSVSAVR